MNELQVIVQQTPGVINWNFEDLKEAIQQEMDSYSNQIYTDETIPIAKKDLAALRKLSKAVDDRRIEIKNKCLEPYEVIQTQAEELVNLIKKPINLIDQQVKNYENEQKKKRKAAIDDYMNEKFHGFPHDIATKAKMKVYDVRWLNATYKVKEWKSIIDDCAEEVNRCLDLLNNTETEFKEEAFNVYGQNLDFSAAVARVQELQAQKERILAAERRRQEEAERRAREEKERLSSEHKYVEHVKPVMSETIEPADSLTAGPVAEMVADEPDSPSVGDVIESVQREAFERVAQNSSRTRDTANGPKDGSVLFRVYGTLEEQKKIQDYIRFLGVRFEIL